METFHSLKFLHFNFTHTPRFLFSKLQPILYLKNILFSSSRVVFPSALHSYTKRRFISPFAPPCYPWLSLHIYGRRIGSKCCIPPVFSGAFSWSRSGVGLEPSRIIFFNSTVRVIVLEVVVL